MCFRSQVCCEMGLVLLGYHIRVSSPRAVEMAQWEQCLPYEPDDLSLDPWCGEAGDSGPQLLALHSCRKVRGKGRHRPCSSPGNPEAHGAASLQKAEDRACPNQGRRWGLVHEVSLLPPHKPHGKHMPSYTNIYTHILYTHVRKNKCSKSWLTSARALSGSLTLLKIKKKKKLQYPKHNNPIIFCRFYQFKNY